MEVAQATVNTLYAVDSDNILVSLIIASLVPFLAKRLYRFFQETWPRILHNFLIRSVLHREVAVIEQDGENDEGAFNKMVDNQVLIEIILEYVGYLAKRAKELQAKRDERAMEARRQRAVGGPAFRPNAKDADDAVDDDAWLPSMSTMVNPPYAAYRYAAIPVARASKTNAASAKERIRNLDEDEPDGTNGDGTAEVATLARYLKDNFQLTLSPTNEVAMEVEPGLFVRYVPTRQSLQELKEQRERVANLAQRGRDSEQAALAARGALEDYLLYDLINKLQENGKRKKKRRAPLGAHEDDEESEGNNAFLQPFGNVDEESDEETEDESSQDNQHNTEAAMQQEQAPRQILIQCRMLYTRAQQDAYIRWHKRTAPPGTSHLHAKVSSCRSEQQGTTVYDNIDEDPAERERLLKPKARIDDFVTRARAWYNEQVSKSGRSSLFLFYPAASEAATALKKQAEKAGGGGDKDDDSWVSVDEDDGGQATNLTAYLRVRRYPIPMAADEADDAIVNTGGKTFNSLFFTQKPRVMKLLQDFQARTGKFAIPGVSHHMTWLVHGPPGTGKTSLVKAMARFLNRHVVVLQMGTIRTNTLLSAWMNEALVNCDGEESLEWELYSEDSYEDVYADDKEVKLLPSEVIYLLEDVDAMNKVDGLVQELEEDEVGEQGDAGGNGSAAGDASSRNGSTIADNDDSGSSSGKSNANAGKEAADAVNHAAGSSEKVNNDDGDDSDDEDDDDDDADDDDESGSDDEREETESAKLRKAIKKQERMERLMRDVLKEFKKDEITVDGLLKIFNGVAIPPGRVIVMTTNHPERLDPRLVHPSVLTMKINMDDFDAEHATKMIRHYYPEYSARAVMPPGSSPEALRAEEIRMTQAVRRRVEALLARNWRHHGDGSSGGQHRGHGAVPSQRINPARLEQACAECSSVEELLSVLESGQYEVRDNIY